MSPSGLHDGWNPRWRRRVANAALVVVLLLELASALALTRSGYSGLVLRGDDRQVGRVSAGSPAELSGFRKDDRLLNRPERDPAPRPGETASFRVVRDGKNVDLALTYASLPSRELARKLSQGMVALAFFVVGWLVYVRRGDLTALLFALFCLNIGLLTTSVMSRPDWLVHHPFLDKSLNDVAVLLLPPFFVHFFLLFPERHPVLRRRSFLRWLYLPTAVAVAIALYFNARLLPAGAAPGKAVFAFESATSLYFPGALVAGAVLFIRSYRRTRDAVLQRRLKGVVLGTVLGVLPLVVMQALVSLNPGAEIPGDRFATLPLVLIPISFGHAIVRYGMFDLEIVVKRGVVYGMLTAILAGVYLAVVSGMGHLVAEAAPGRGHWVLTVAAMLIMAVVFTPLRVRIEAWADRTFYREKHGLRETLRRVARGLARMMALDEVLDLLADTLASSFHPEFLALYVRGGGGDRPLERAREAGATPAGLPPGGSPELGELAGWLALHGETVNLERPLAGEISADMPLRMRRRLGAARVAAVVPFIAERELIAVLFLGHKKSGEIMGGEDTELLDTVANHAATAIQNAWLHQEALKRQEFARDLQTARAVQRALLPADPPHIPGFEIEMVSLPSREIGGDLYDYLPLASGRWALMMGDAAGSGIGAALLMAALQATVQAESLDSASPAAVVSAANARLSRRRDDNRFASLVYAELDPLTANLTSVNAGHPPPLVVEPAGRVSALETGGMLLGVQAEAEYAEETVTLAPGTLVLFYTDGIIEHAGDTGEEYGLERLRALVRASARLPLADLAELVLRAVSAHGHVPIADDATLLLLRRSEQ